MAFGFFKRRRKERQEAELDQEMQKLQEEFDKKKAQQEQDLEKARKESEETRKNMLQDLAKGEEEPLSDSECKRMAQECCEAVRSIERQNEDAKKEYNKVTNRLLDMEKIDSVSGDGRKILESHCKKIMTLTQERNRYKDRNIKITDAQMRAFAPFEEDLAEEVRKMYDAEAYQTAIERDLNYLEKEKDIHRKEQRQISAGQKMLQRMAKALIVLMVSLFVLFGVINYGMRMDMTFPYLGTIALAAASALFLFGESTRNRRDMAIAGKKLNKAISLSNRVKIKYINNKNVLDYNQEKFQVTSARDFEEKWQEYHSAKEYERKFKENTEQLRVEQEALMSQLRELEVKDVEVWLSETLAIVDQREMVEIRHALNVRRGRIRDSIHRGEETKKTLVAKLDYLIEKYPKVSRDIIAIIQSYQE